MTTKAQKAAEADNTKADEKVDTSETVPAGTQTTSDKAAESETPTKVEDNDAAAEQEENLDEALSGDVSLSADKVDNSLGTVKEGKVDAPWTYLTSDHFDGDSPLVRTADSDDGDVVRWNVQHAFEERDGEDAVVLVEVAATPGQTFTLAELPDIEAMKANGINVQQWLSGLPVRADLGDDEPHRRGIPA